MRVRLVMNDTSGAADELALTDGQRARLGVRAGARVMVRAGNKQISATVRVVPGMLRGTIGLTKLGMERLSLQSVVAQKFTYRVKRTSGRELRLGPIIGVLIALSRDEIRQNSHGFRIHHLLWNIIEMGGFAYFFALQDIDWKRQCIFGHTILPGTVPMETPVNKLPLQAAHFPFPDAIYRRRSIPYRTLDRIQRDVTPRMFNNPRASHKLRQATALQSSPALAVHVPDAKELRSAADLDAMLDRYGAVFVKRSGVGAGKGVARVIRTASGAYELTRRINTRKADEVRDTVGSFGALTMLLADVTGYEWSSSSWCVQRAIVPARWNGRVFDLRVAVQKSGLGRWIVNGMYVRIAPTDDAVITRWGEYKQARRFLAVVWPARAAQIYADVSDFALRCTAVLDKRLGVLGDLGVDIMLDGTGKHWFIEANPGPGYLMIGEQDDDYWRQLSTPLAFASLLAGFPIAPASSRGNANPQR